MTETESAPPQGNLREDPAKGARILRDHAEPRLARGRTKPPEAARELAERLAGDTLALRLLGRAIREHPVAVGGYRGAAERLEAAMEALGEAVPESHRPLAAVCETAMRLLDGGQMARVRPLLSVLSFLGAEGVRVPMRRLDVGLLRGTMVDTGPGELDLPGLELALGVLAAHGFVDRRWSDGEPVVALHPLVSEVVREWLGAEALKTAGVVSVMLARSDGVDPELEDAAYRTVLGLRGRMLGEEHPDTLWIRHRLAWVAARRGELDRAGEAYREVLEAQRQALGAEHSDVLWTQARLAWVMAQRGELDRAEDAYREVLEVQERVLGARHPYTRLTREMLSEVVQEAWSHSPKSA